MWRNVYDYMLRVFKITEQTEKNTGELKEQQRTLNDLTMIVQRLAFEQERQRENEIHEREKLALRLENILLRSERALPPGNIQNQASTNELLQAIDALRHEMEALRKRVEQLEQQ